MIVQTYMSTSVFITSWIVLTYNSFHFSYFGIIGAVLWVPASLCSVNAIKYLGLGIAQGIWAGLIILVSFLWGAVVFRDPVKSLWLSILGLVLIGFGIVGIATCKTEKKEEKKEENLALNEEIEVIVDTNKKEGVDQIEEISKEIERTSLELKKEEELKETPSTVNSERPSLEVKIETNISEKLLPNHSEELKTTQEIHTNNVQNIEQNSNGDIIETIVNDPNAPNPILRKIVKFLLSMKNIILGFVFAFGVGILGGSMFVPNKYNPDQSITYVLSFGIGVAIVNAVMFPFHFIIKREFPKFHFKQAALPCLAAGLWWSVGNFACTYVVMSPLGLTVGYPLVQCSFVIAGICGIVFYKEIRNWKILIQFFASTFIFLVPGSIILGIFGKE